MIISMKIFKLLLIIQEKKTKGFVLTFRSKLNNQNLWRGKTLPFSACSTVFVTRKWDYVINNYFCYRF